MVNYTDLINGLSAEVPFVGPESQERSLGFSFKARLGANESIFGPSEKAVAAMREMLIAGIWKYGDPENFELKNAIALRMNSNIENIVVGEGIDALLGYLVRLIVEPGVKVVSSHGAYPTFNYHVKGSGGELILVPFRNDHEDLESLVNVAVKESAKLIYFSNPDNPMGTAVSGRKIEEIIKYIPKDCLLCLDEAYAEFAFKDFIPRLDADNPDVLRFRTFSKAYGLAGARIGFAIGEKKLVKNFDKIRNHFGVNRVAQAGALAALSDQIHLEKVINRANHAKQKIMKISSDSGLLSIESHANFVAVDCGGDGVYAVKVMQNLIKRGVFVRMPSVEPLNRCIRITVGDDEDLDYFKEQLPLALKEAQ